jgi:GTP pyrophosphokinase
VTESFTDTPLLTHRFDAALHFATRHHARHLRKGTPVPYAAHLLATASLALEMHGDEDEAIGALLHDVVEDGGGAKALGEIEAAFGPAVARIVLDNSDSVDVRAGGGAAWYRRKRAYVDAFPRKSPAALRVCLADKLHNARSILLDYRTHGDELWSRFGQGLGLATRVYYRELAAAFERERERMGETAQPYVDELRRVVDAITTLAESHQGPDSHAMFGLVNPASGERIDVVSETPELLVLESTWTRPGHRAPAHVHPGLEERFVVLDGVAAFEIDGRTVSAAAGETVVVPPGTRHEAYNPTGQPVRMRIEFRPAGRWLEFVQRVFAGEDAVSLMPEYPEEIARA